MGEQNTAQKIVNEYVRRLSLITIANGYSADAGKSVKEGWGAMAHYATQETNYPFCGISPGHMQISRRGAKDLTITMQIEAVIVDKAGPALSNNLLGLGLDMLSALLDDQSGKRLGGLAIESSIDDLVFNIPADATPFGWVSSLITTRFIYTIGGRHG